MNHPKHIILISPPWAMFNRPSVQLGTLKAYLNTQFPELKTQAHHLYLKIAESLGYKLYQMISGHTWSAECVYAALLYPAQMEHIERLFYRETGGKSALHGMDFRTLTRQVKEISDVCIKNINWEDAIIAGLSVCLCQLTAALYFAKKIKQKFPNLFIVIGGSGFPAAETPQKLSDAFPYIDAVVKGEGELPLTRLVHAAQTSEISEVLQTAKFGSFCQLETLNQLPMPDYDDYFALLGSFKPEKRFFPILPAEMSRGCWWQSRKSKKSDFCRDFENSEGLTIPHPAGCAFCNLNLQWDGYRAKESSQIVSEIDCMTSRYKALSVAFTDNVLPKTSSLALFEQMELLNKDLKLFCEIRASVSRDMLRAMKAAGADELQIGIEALSTGLLKKLNKGTTAIQNLEIMRDCESLGIKNISNLILCFPGSTQDDADDTLRTLEFAMPFRPLKPVRFWLGLESPVWQNPRCFGIKAVFNHPHYAVLFPKNIVQSLRFMVQAYRGDLGIQKKLWHPVKKKLAEWQKFYDALHKGLVQEPILSFRDGRDFLIIRERKLNREPYTHRLTGISRDIYIFCLKHRSLKRIMNRFPDIDEVKLMPFLKMMTDKKLMFEESGKYLSLAVPVNGF